MTKNITLTAKTAKELEAFITAMTMAGSMNGVTVTVGNSVSEEPKVETKKATTSKSKKTTSSKSEDTFDRTKYEATAKQLGCYGKHGVWKCCRPTVYAVMDGSMTLANGKKAVAKVKKENGWS